MTNSPPLRDETRSRRKIAAAVDRRIGLGNDMILFFQRRQITDAVGHPAILYFTIGSLDKTEIIDSRISRQRRDQTDVRTFRCLDRTNPAVMGRMHVADFETGALASQTARAREPRVAACG